jgi:predicted transcriptional regulator
MAKKKVRYVDINANQRGFVAKLISGDTSHDFSDVKLLRSLLSNEKARILHTIKVSKPKSIYALTKILQRDFKSVRNDVKLLERFGFIELHVEKKGKRESLMPSLSVERLQIMIDV